MRTSAKVTLAISIVLLLLGIGLVVYGTYASIPQPQIYEYSAPGRYSYVYRYSSYSSYSFQGELCTRLGRLSFLSGLALMFIFTYLAIQPVEKKDEKCKCNKDEKAECKCDENKAEEVKTEAETKPDEEKKTETPTVIQLGAPEEKTE